MPGRGLVAGLCALTLAFAPAALADPSNTSPPQVSGGSQLSLTGSWSSSDSVQYGYQWQSCSYPNAVLGDGAVAYFRLGDSAADVRGFNQPSLDGLPAAAPGGIAGDADGGSGFSYVPWLQGLRYPSTTGAQFAPDDFSTGTAGASIEAWIYPTGLPHTDGFVAGFGSDTSGDASLNLELFTGGGATRLAAFDGLRHYVANAGPISTGRWYHVALTYDGTSIRLYLDGTLVSTTAEQSSFSLIPLVGRIDASVPATTTVQSFGGTIDDVAFYNVPLSTPEVRNHAEAGVDPSSDARCNDIPYATSPTLTVTPDLAGTRVRGQVEASDDSGQSVAWSSEVAIAGAVTPPAPQDLTAAPQSGPTLLTGTVVDASGAPVAGARVSAYENLTTRTRVALPLLAEAYTDASGAFALAYPGAPDRLLNLVVTARGAGLGVTTYLTREYDAAASEWLDDTGAEPASLALAMPADAASDELSGASRRFPVPCPPPQKSLFAGPTPGIMSVGDVHTWSADKARLSYAQGSKTTVNIAASSNPNSGFVSTSSTATFSGGYSLSQSYPTRGPNSSLAETTAANAAEYQTISGCWKRTYTTEPYSFIGGTTSPRSVPLGSNGKCPTRITDNSVPYVPGSVVTRSTGKGVTYSGGFSINFPAFSIGLTVRTDWSNTTSETWWPQSGAGNRLWFCGDGSNRYWYKAQRIFQGPWTS